GNCGAGPSRCSVWAVRLALFIKVPPSSPGCARASLQRFEARAVVIKTIKPSRINPASPSASHLGLLVVEIAGSHANFSRTIVPAASPGLNPQPQEFAVTTAALP